MTFELDRHQLKNWSRSLDWPYILRIDPRASGLDTFATFYSESTYAFPVTYGSYNTKSLLLAHALPFIFPIPSERALARELVERDFFQELCGFDETDEAGNVVCPSRAMLWHFRHLFSLAFPFAIVKILISLRLCLGEEVPFVRPLQGGWSAIPKDTIPFDIRVRDQLATGHIQFLGREDEQLVLDGLESLGIGSQQTGIGRGLAEFIRLPVRVYAKHTRDVEEFLIVKPWWMGDDGSIGEDGRSGDYSLESYRNKPYTACNLLVLREIDGRQELLIARRLTGSGRGLYAMPGGKCRPGETVRGCAERELREETSLTLLSAYPISLHYNRSEQGYIVKSVGIVVDAFEGKKRWKETTELSPWKWKPLEELSTNIFVPSKLVIEAFSQDHSKQLDWADVEDQLPLWE